MDIRIKKLKTLLDAIKNKSYYKTSTLPIQYGSYEIKNETSYLLNNGYIKRQSLHYYKTNFNKRDIKNIIDGYKEKIGEIKYVG